MAHKNMPDIALIISGNCPASIVAEFESELQSPGLNLKIHQTPGDAVYNVLEWAAPTLIIAYVLKPYFESFLKKMGEDHYLFLKAWIKKTVKKLRLIKEYTIVAPQSTDKIKKGNTQSKIFSIQTITNTDQQLTFLFDNKLTDENWDFAIERLMQLLKEHFTDGKTDQLTIEIKANNLEKAIYARIKTDTMDWEFTDMKKLAAEEIAKRKA